MNKRKRASGDEVELRIEQIRNLLAIGYATQAIVQVCESRWQVTTRQAFRYLEKAREKEGEFAQAGLDVHRGQLLASATHILNQALQAKELSAAIQALELKRKTINDIERKGRISGAGTSTQTNTASTELQEALRALGEAGQTE